MPTVPGNVPGDSVVLFLSPRRRGKKQEDVPHFPLQLENIFINLPECSRASRLLEREHLISQCIPYFEVTSPTKPPGILKKSLTLSKVPSSNPKPSRATLQLHTGRKPVSPFAEIITQMLVCLTIWKILLYCLLGPTNLCPLDASKIKAPLLDAYWDS